MSLRIKNAKTDFGFSLKVYLFIPDSRFSEILENI